MKKKSRIVIATGIAFLLIATGAMVFYFIPKWQLNRAEESLETAHSLLKQKKYETALGLYKKILKCTKDPEHTACLYENIIICLKELRSFNEGLTYCEKIISLLPELPLERQKYFELFTYYAFSVCYSKTGAYSKAIFYLKKAIPLLQSNYGSDSKKLIEDYDCLANLYAVIGKFDQSREIIAKQIKISLEKNNYEDVCRSIISFSFSFYEQKRHDEASAYLSPVFFYLEFCGKNQQTLLREKVFYIMAFYSFENNNIADAVNFLMKSFTQPLREGQKILLRKIVNKLLFTTLTPHQFYFDDFQGHL